MWSVCIALLLCLLGVLEDVEGTWHAGLAWRSVGAPWKQQQKGFPGFKLEGAILREFYGSQHLVTQCALKCFQDAACRSYSFSPASDSPGVTFVPATGVCILHSVTHMHAELKPDTGFSFFLREAFSLTQTQAVEPPSAEECSQGGIPITISGQQNTVCACPPSKTGSNCQEKSVSSAWSVWSVWGGCVGSCGGSSRQSRHRQCMIAGKEVTPSFCPGLSKEVQICDSDDCADWATWSDWSACSSLTTCGSGVLTRRRHCQLSQQIVNHTECVGLPLEVSICQTTSCDVPVRLVGSGKTGEGRVQMYDDVMSLWGDVAGDHWTLDASTILCQQLGFGGAFEAIRDDRYGSDASLPILGNMSCTGDERSLAACPHAPWRTRFDRGTVAGVICTVNGAWGSWSSWTQCSFACANVTRKRQRFCDSPPPNGGGKLCEGKSPGADICNYTLCLSYGEWSVWEDCTSSCGGGEQSRTRTCSHGDLCEGPDIETQECGTETCEGDVTEWTAWGRCSLTCGGGTQTRSRLCIPPEAKPDWCDTFNVIHSRDCSSDPCPVDGVWSPWGDWITCSVTCGGGSQSRNRTCEGQANGGNDCGGSAEDTRGCNSDLCPTPGTWSSWTEWGLCSATCGGGVRYKTRECNVTLDEVEESSEACRGDNSTNEPCHTFDCLPFAGTCWELGERGLVDNVPAQLAGEADGSSVWIYCNMTALDGARVTEISHDSMEPSKVQGYETAGGFVKTLVYDLSNDDIAAIMSLSSGCQQFIRWQCFSSKIYNSHSPNTRMTYWLNRDGRDRYYWSGNNHTIEVCPCYLDGSCAKQGEQCNCDANDEVLREDSGYVTYLPDLPVSAFMAGDTGGINEYGIFTIGPLQCFGVGNPDNGDQMFV